ncbi:hypothetical protein CPB84DRAFT_1789233, partial [Gymnopilus junonius]
MHKPHFASWVFILIQSVSQHEAARSLPTEQVVIVYCMALICRCTMPQSEGLQPQHVLTMSRRQFLRVSRPQSAQRPQISLTRLLQLPNPNKSIARRALQMG